MRKDFLKWKTDLNNELYTQPPVREEIGDEKITYDNSETQNNQESNQ